MSFLLPCVDQKDADAAQKKKPVFWRLPSSNGPSGPRRECGVNSERSGELRTAAAAAFRSATARRAALSAEMGRLCRPRAFESPKGGAALWAAEPKKEAPAKQVLLFWRRHPDLNRGIRVLQTLALPLGYVAACSDSLCRLKHEYFQCFQDFLLPYYTKLLR